MESFLVSPIFPFYTTDRKIEKDEHLQRKHTNSLKFKRDFLSLPLIFILITSKKKKRGHHS